LTADRAQSIVAVPLTLVLLLPLGVAVAASSGYQDWWLSPRGWRILLDTACFCLLASAVATGGGYLVGRSGFGWSALACVPLAVPSSLLGSAWIVALGRSGPLGDWVTVFDWPIASAAVGLRYVGIAALMFAAQRVGTGPAVKVFRVRYAWWWLGIKPALGPAVVAMAATFILVSADHIMPSMFLVHTYGTQVLIQYNALQDLPGAAALAGPMLLPAVAAIGVVACVVRPWLTVDSNTPSPKSWWTAALVILLSLGVPITLIVRQVGSPASLAEAFREMYPEVIRTILITSVCAPICVAVGWLLAESWLRDWRRRRWPWSTLIILNLAAPPSMLALGLIDMSSNWPLRVLRDGDGPLLVAYAARFVPVVVLVLFIAGLCRPRLPDTAARLFNVPVWKRIWRIDWPARRVEITATLILCGLLIATELEVSLLLASAGTSTVGVRLYTLIHTAPDSQVSAAAVVVLILLVPWIGLLGYLAGRRHM
jgi:ABC-type Fe3+ transport system permease subunit